MALTYERRAAIFKIIDSTSKDICGSMDLINFKSGFFYLFFFFVLSKKANEAKNYINASDEEAESFKPELIKKLGYYIRPSDLFSNLYIKALTNEAANVCDDVDAAFKRLQESTQAGECFEYFADIFNDFAFNSNNFGFSTPRRRKNILSFLDAIKQIGEKIESARDISGIFSDSYEHILAFYSKTAGRGGGEYYTPESIGDLMFEITRNGRDKIGRVYDPTCGSCGLLSSYLRHSDTCEVTEGFYGQDINLLSSNLGKMNLLTNGLSCSMIHIKHGDTLTTPFFQDVGGFDAIIANPPFSVRWEPTINDERFKAAGIAAPANNGDLAFSLHCIHNLKPDGVCSLLCSAGLLYRGGREAKIKRYLIEKNYIDSVIALPKRLFLGTAIQTAIITYKKNKQNNNILFINAENEYKRQNLHSIISEENQSKIIDAYKARTEIAGFSTVVDCDEILKTDSYNLAPSAYVTAEDETEKIDIIELNKEIKRLIIQRREQEDKYLKFIDQLTELLPGD